MCSLGIEPTTFCAANAMLYRWATGTASVSQRCPQTPEEILRAQSLVDCEQLSIHSNSSIGLSEMSSNTWRDPESAVAGGLWTAEHSFKHGSGSQRCPQTPEEILRAQSLVDCEQLSINSNMARVHRDVLKHLKRSWEAVAGGLWTAEHSFKHGSGSQSHITQAFWQRWSEEKSPLRVLLALLCAEGEERPDPLPHTVQVETVWTGCRSALYCCINLSLS